VRRPSLYTGTTRQRDRATNIQRLQFIAESPRRDGHGTVRLDGYDRGSNDQILILVSADDGKDNTSLVR